MVVVSKLERRFAGVAALRGVSFTARPGEVTGLLGRNGAGKTTTLRIVTGFLAPSGGAVTVDGFDVASDGRRARARIGYLPEGVPLHPEMRVREYLEFRAAVKGVAGRFRRTRVEEAAARVGLADALGRIVGQLSRGFRQRVGLADALTHRPSVLVLDEPTEGLDPSQRRELLGLVGAIGRDEGRTVILSTHVLPEAETLCDRVVIIDRGLVVAEGTPAELVLAGGGATGSVEVRVEARGDGERLLAAVRALPGVDEVRRTGGDEGGVVSLVVRAARDVREAVGAAVVAAGGTLRELHLQSGALEQLFAARTGGDHAARTGTGDDARTGGDDAARPPAPTAPRP